jgi:hypothetical protein
MSIFKNLRRVTVNTILLPIDIAKDIVTVHGLATGRSESYSSTRIDKLCESYSDMSKDIEKLAD